MSAWDWPEAAAFWQETAAAPPVSGRDKRGSGDGRGGGSDLGILARGGMLSLVGSVSSSLLGFALVVVITRGLHAGRGGVLIEAITLFMILSNSVELGADTAIVRMVPWYRARSRTQDIRRTLQIAFWPVLAFGLVSAWLVYTYAPQLADIFIRGRGVDEGTSYIRLFAPFVPVASLTTVALAATRGFGTMTPYVAIQNVGIPLVRPVLILAVLAMGLGTVPIALAWAVPLAAGCILAFAAVRTLHRKAVRQDRHAMRERASDIRTLAAEFWRFAGPRGLAGILTIVIIQFNILLVGAFRSSREAGIFGAASRLTGVGTFALQAIGLAIAPQISELLAKGERGRAETVFQTATWWLMVLSWPIYLTMAVFAPFLMRVFGPEFVAGQTSLMVMSLALLALVGTGNNKIVLLMGGGSAWNLGITTVSLITTLGLNLLLIPRYGMNGSALAFAAGVIVDNAMTTLVVRFRLKVQPFGPGYAIVVAASTLCFGVLGLLVRRALGMTMVSFVSFGLVSTALYLGLIWRYRDVLQLGFIREALRIRGRVRAGGPVRSA